MTRATSADPWANHVSTDGFRRWLSRRLTSPGRLRLDRGAIVLFAAAAHLSLLALLAPALIPGGAALLLIATALLVVVMALPAAPEPSLTLLALARDSADRCPSAEPASILIESRPQTCEPIRLYGCTASRPEPPILVHPAAGHRDWADLMARVSHELRTPLNAVLGFSDLMDRGLFGPLGHQRYEEYVRHIHDSGRELLKSAEDTLAVTSLLAAPERHRPTDVVDLERVIADAWQFFGQQPAARGISIGQMIEPGTEVIGERRTLRQALVNLISEALARASTGGRISIAAHADHGRIVLEIGVPAAPDQCQREPGSLHTCLARTLLEYHGAPLVEEVSPASGWRATTCLDRATQHDFFLVGRHPGVQLTGANRRAGCHHASP